MTLRVKKLKSLATQNKGNKMQFPITRESLKAFNRENTVEEKEKQKRYDFYRTLIKNICTDVEQTFLNSKTPVTQYVWKDIRIIGGWKNIISEPHILKKIINNPNIDLVQYYSSDYHDTLTKYLPEFIDLLKETFIDCDIIIDPLKTYLIIDWS